MKLHDDFGMALEPITVPVEDGMVVKSEEGDEEAPVTHTAILNPAPNPFNPEAELRFDRRRVQRRSG